MQVTRHPESAPLTPDQMRRGQSWVIRCSVVSVLLGAGLSDRVISLFILGINPDVTDATLAFFFALTPLTALLTVLTSPLVMMRGKKQVMLPFYLASAPFVVILAGLPFLHGHCPPATLVGAVAVALAAYAACRSLGAAGWFPIINDNVPDDIRGRFFGRLRTSWQLMLLFYTATVGWFLGHKPELWQFQVVFVVAILANVIVSAGVLRIPEAPLIPRPKGLTFWRMMAEPFRDRLFVSFLLFGALFSLSSAMAGPFALRCMKGTLGAGDNYVVWTDTLSSLGAAATLPLWGRIVDRFGGRPIFALLIPVVALLNGIWLFASPADPHWRVLVAVFYLLQGIAVFGIGVGITDMMLGSAKKGHQSAYINIAYVLNTVSVGVGPFLGTWVARVFAGVDVQWGAITLDVNRWVFVVRFVLMLIPLCLVPRLSREHGGHVGEALQRLSAGLLNLLPAVTRGQREREDEGEGRNP
jgi:MFS family permease